MTRIQRGKLATLAFSLVAIAGMTTAVAYSPTLYRMFCAATGYGGATQRAIKPVAATTSKDAETVTVTFDANVAPGLDWEFRPEQRELQVKVGEPTQAYYYARNNSDQTVVARATYNVSPGEAGLYFFKVQCFCFTEERLGPGQEAKMPLVFYVDKEFMKDSNTKDIPDITLSYTFFKQDNLTPEQVAAARDLSKGSEQEVAEQAGNPVASFASEVRRQ